MELKHIKFLLTHLFFRTFNRTTMELKHASTTPHNLLSKLLIEPLWNWNTDNVLSQGFHNFPFNRTTMELKLIHKILATQRIRTFNRTTMELKLVQFSDSVHAHDTFNRTTMELKPAALSLIAAPAFTFNRTTMELKLYWIGLCGMNFWAFNRTTMELKHNCGVRSLSSHKDF